MLDVSGSLWSVAEDLQVEAALRLRTAGLRRLHWDMTDGHFANVGGFTAAEALAITERTGLIAEAHIMAERPVKEVDAWTDFCELIIVHAESNNWKESLDRIAQRGCLPGLAISPNTPVTIVPADIAVLCMSITPGTAGSAFQLSALAKVTSLRETSATRQIGLDGGVQRRHVERAIQAGASWVVVGTDLFTGDGEGRWVDMLGKNIEA